MSQNFIPIKGSLPRRLPQKEFRLPVEQSIKIIDEVRKLQKYSKTIRPDQNRKQYQNLLQWVNTSLQSTKQLVHNQTMHQSCFSQQPHQQQTVDQQVQKQQRRIIQILMSQMVQMFKRQCKQKSQIMQIIHDFFNQLINQYSKHYERQYIDTLKNYNIQLQELEGEYQIKLNQCNKRISYLEGEKETKWKNIYMLAKDNRILRRQKGKLLRSVQQQDQKIKLLQRQLCQVVKQNQMNKLVIRFQSDNQNLKVFMRNRLALMKFQKIIEKYPKKAMKVLNNDLLKLQIEQLNSLDSKIDYIKRVIIQSGDIFDEYEDLNDLMTQTNKMVFNVFTQTDPQDIQVSKQFRQIATNYDMEFRLKRFDTWQQIYDINIIGWPEMRQKFVYFRNQNQKTSTQSYLPNKKSDNHQPKQFFLLQISSRQVHQCINMKTKNNNDKFNRIINTGVKFNPLLKDKTKLYFVMPYENPILNNDPNDDMDLTFRKTLPIGTKKQKQAYVRKSQVISQKQFANNRLNILKPSQKQRNSAITLQRQLSQEQHMESPTIEERSQLDSSINTEEEADQVQQFNFQQDQQTNQPHLPRFKTKRRSVRNVRRGTEIILSGIDRNSTRKMSIFKEQNINAEPSSRYSLNIDDHSSLKGNKKQRISTQGPNGQKTPTKSQFALNKMNRIKTSQNVRNSKMSNSNNKNSMDKIFEEQEQNNSISKTPHHWQSLNKSSRMSYMPESKTLSKSKFSETMGNLNHLVSKQNSMNELEGILAERTQKYQMTINPINPINPNTAAQKISKFAMRNSSFNLMKFKKRQSANIDNYSMNSYASSQNQSSFNYKVYINQMQPKKSFEILQSEVLNPVSIKPFQVKKLAEKIIKNMYSRRKQLLSSPTSASLKAFIENLWKQIYGNNWKGEKNLLRYAFTIQDRQNSPSIKTFSLMLNTNLQIEYLEDLFRLYVTMLEKNQFSNSENPLITSKTKGTAIFKYLLSVYFDEVTANDIQQSLPFMNQFQIDLNDIFIVVETQIRKYTVETDIYSFLFKLLPQNQSYIEFSQMKEILHMFKNDEKYHAHIARLKYFFKTYGKIVGQQQNIANKTQPAKTARASKTVQKGTNPSKNQSKQAVKQQPKCEIEILPIHRVCLYLKRYQWTDIIEINTHVEERYHKLVGVFIQEETIKFITKYCSVIDGRHGKKNTIYQNGAMSMSISTSQQTTSNQRPPHPLAQLLKRTKQLIRNYYRYKGPLDRCLLMFVHVSILTYELDLNLYDVFSESMGLLNLEYKKLKTKEEVDGFMKD